MKKLKAKLMPYLLSIMIATSTIVIVPPATAVDVQAKHLMFTSQLPERENAIIKIKNAAA